MVVNAGYAFDPMSGESPVHTISVPGQALEVPVSLVCGGSVCGR